MVEVNMAKLKNLYVGTFQFRHSTFIERAYAYSEKQAYVVICQRIAKKQDVDPWLVMEYFRDHPDDYSVKLEVEFEEVEA